MILGATGSFFADWMIAIPYSMGSLSSIAYSNGDYLVQRAIDVIPKERHRLVMAAHETPRSEVHPRRRRG
ncbi:MAG: flavoprotein [Bradyrhizobium sp.]